MKIIAVAIILVGMTLASAFYTAPACAQATRTWISGVGSDSNPCSRTAPCKTWAGAIGVTAAGGEIDALDPGGFGAVTITQSITLDGGGGQVADVLVSGTSGIVIAAAANDVVTIRNVRFQGLLGNGSNPGSAGTNGIQINTAGSVLVENCVIENFAQNGINNTPTSGGTKLTVKNTILSNNASAGISFQPQNGRGLLEVSDSEIFGNQSGIVAQPTIGQIASVTLDQVKLTGNTQNGLVLGGAGVVAGTMRNSVAGSNTLDGVLANADQVFFTVEEFSIVANLSSGIHANSAGTNLNVTASTISGNGTGVKATSGSIVSFGNNTLNGNGSDGAFTSTAALK